MYLYWVRCPSVTTGGKENFYVLYSADKKKIGTVVWDRAIQKYRIEDKDDRILGTENSLMIAKRQAVKLLSKGATP